MVFFVIIGNRPRIAKDTISPGENIPEGDSILASSLPALTNTRVPGSMPIWETQKKVFSGIFVRPMTRFMSYKGKTGISWSVNK